MKSGMHLVLPTHDGHDAVGDGNSPWSDDLVKSYDTVMSYEGEEVCRYAHDVRLPNNEGLMEVQRRQQGIIIILTISMILIWSQAVGLLYS